MGKVFITNVFIKNCCACFESENSTKTLNCFFLVKYWAWTLGAAVFLAAELLVACYGIRDCTLRFTIATFISFLVCAWT